MDPIPLKLPARATVQYNSLYAEPTRLDLVQDILLVSLPEDIEIDVGWYPQWDPSGEFCIRVYQYDWDNELEKPIHTKDPMRVVVAVNWLAARYTIPPRSQTHVLRGQAVAKYQTVTSSAPPRLRNVGQPGQELQDA